MQSLLSRDGLSGLSLKYERNMNDKMILPYFAQHCNTRFVIKSSGIRPHLLSRTSNRKVFVRLLPEFPAACRNLPEAVRIWDQLCSSSVSSKAGRNSSKKQSAAGRCIARMAASVERRACSNPGCLGPVPHTFDKGGQLVRRLDDPPLLGQIHPREEELPIPGRISSGSMESSLFAETSST